MCREQNEEIIDKFLNSTTDAIPSDFKIGSNLSSRGMLRICPNDQNGSGFFIARLVKIKS